MRPNDRSYFPSHEWCQNVNGIATIGITDYAVSHLSSLVFLDLPTKGAKVSIGKPFAEIESVKAVSDIYSPVTGEVVEVNEALPDDLESLNSDPFGAGWMIKVKVVEDSSEQMDLATYEKHLAAQPD